jgi:hypothetical protein
MKSLDSFIVPPSHAGNKQKETMNGLKIGAAFLVTLQIG